MVDVWEGCLGGWNRFVSELRRMMVCYLLYAWSGMAWEIESLHVTWLSSLRNQRNFAEMSACTYVWRDGELYGWLPFHSFITFSYLGWWYGVRWVIADMYRRWGMGRDVAVMALALVMASHDGPHSSQENVGYTYAAETRILSWKRKKNMSPIYKDKDKRWKMSLATLNPIQPPSSYLHASSIHQFTVQIP